MQFLKNVVVLVIAYFSIGTVVGVLDSVLVMAVPDSMPNPSKGSVPASAWLWWHIVEVGCVTVASAYFAASVLARGATLRAGILLVWMVLVGISSLFLMTHLPLWFRTAMAVVPVPAIALGTYVSRQSSGARELRRRVFSSVRRAIVWGAVLACLIAAHWYQNGPPRRYVADRVVFWYVELPGLVTIGALAGLAVGKWRLAKQRDATNVDAGRLTTG